MNRLQSAGLGLSLMALVGVGTLNGGGVFAQDATPTPNTTVTEDSTTTETDEVERNAFLDAFAAQLGVTDTAQIDAAILGAYSEILAEKVAAGDITQEQADEMLAEIEAGDMPFGMGGFGGFGGKNGGMPGGMRGDMRGDRDNDRGEHREDDRGDKPGRDDDDDADDATDDSATPAVEASPAAETANFV